jgi:hypothetical protein
VTSLVDIVPRPRSADSRRVIAFLHAGIPLSLLLDLAQDDPHSKELYAIECDY